MKSRILIFTLVLGLGAVAVGWVYESRLRTRTEPAQLVIPDNIDYFLTNLDYRAMNTAGELDYRFSSRRLDHYQRDDISRLDLPSVSIYRGADLWRVDALDGEFEHRDNLLRLRRQVVMQKSGPDPIELLTESIRFEPDRNLVSSEASVLLRSGSAQIRAERAVFDLSGRVYRLTNARAIYANDDS